MRSSIWIADGDLDEIEHTRDALSRLGHDRQVHTFCNGKHIQEAFLSKHIHNPKFLIIDSRLPGISGLELVHYLLANKLISRLHTLLWSGAYSPAERHFCATNRLICHPKPASFFSTVDLFDQTFPALRQTKVDAIKAVAANFKKRN